MRAKMAQVGSFVAPLHLRIRVQYMALMQLAGRQL